jgi:hypothetical protein
MMVDNLTNFKTMLGLIERVKTPASSVNNLNYLHNLHEIWVNLLNCISSNPMAESVIPFLQKQSFLQYIRVGEKFFIFSLIFLMFKSSCAAFSGKKVYFILLTTILILLQAPITPNCPASFHLLFLLPFVYILITLGITKMNYLFNSLLKLNKICCAIIIYTLFSLLLLSNFQIVMANNEAIDKTHGAREWSTDAFNELVAWLRHENIKEIISLCDIDVQLQLVTNDNITFPLNLDIDAIVKIRNKKGNINLIVKSGGDIYYVASLELFRDVLKNIKGYNVLIKKRFYDKRGEIAFIVFKVYPNKAV